MTYGFGFQIFRPNGTLLLTNGSVGFTLLDVISVATNAGSGSKAYPDAAGLELLTTQISNAPFVYTSRFHSVSVSYAAGYPVVSWTLVTPNAGADIYVFAR